MNVIIFSDDNAWIGFARYAGAYRIASELRMAGYTVQVVDFFSSYTFEQIEELLRLYVTEETLFVGFATSLWVRSSEYKFREYLANSYEAHLKTLFPHSDEFMNRLFDSALKLNSQIKFVVGGSKAESLGSERIDHWIIGQGESAALFLTDNLKKKKFHNIPKILEGKKYSYENFSSSKITWSNTDYVFRNESLPIEIARGCIFRCSFCYYPLNGKKKNEYIKSKEHLKLELLDAYERFGTETFLFTDDLINDSPEKVEMLSSLAKELPFKLEWSGFCRLDMIHTYPKMADQLLESGLRSVYFGIETLHKEAGIRSGKGLGRDKIMATLENVRAIWGHQIMVNAGFIVGLPGEPKESIKNTLDWLLTEDCPIDVADVGVLNIKARENLSDVAIYNSRIGENPNQFGLKVSQTFWEHDQLNSREAFELVDQFYANPRFLDQKRGAPFTMYPRLKNLGYSFDEIAKVSIGNLEFKVQAALRRQQLFEEYSRKILKMQKNFKGNYNEIDKQ